MRKKLKHGQEKKAAEGRLPKVVPRLPAEEATG